MSGHTDAPETLHRGVKLPLDEFGMHVLTSDLLPGSDGVDENGNRVVHDGNEWGVYMSSNPQVARNYSSPQHGAPIPDSPRFNWRHSASSSLVVPRVGIQYAISSQGLPGLRPPELNGVYDQNNGFEGKEWIADMVPADAHRLAALRLGEDTLTPVETIDVSRGHEAALDELRSKVESRMARIAAAHARIKEIPADRLGRPGVVDRALQDLIVRGY